MWEDVLGRPAGVHERFFDVGGNSLRAIQVLSRIRARIGAEITLEQLFAHPMIAALAQLLPAAAQTREAPLTSTGGPGRYSVAPTQRLLLRIEQVESQRDAFNRNDLYEVHGSLDPELLRESFAAIVRRHETMRTTFHTADGQPAMVVHAPGELNLPFRAHDLRGTPEALSAFVRSRIRQPFDVQTDGLVGADLLRTGEAEYTLLTAMHQLVSDGRSAQILHDELLRAYDELAAGRSPASWPAVAQYKEVARWRNERLTFDALDEHRRFWRAELAGASPSVGLATDNPRPEVAAFLGERLYVDVADDVAAGVYALARSASVTDFVVVWTALSLLLAAETSTDDVTIGTYTRGRNRTEFEDGVGFYINTVPLRMRVSPSVELRPLLAEAQRTVLRAFKHEGYPYELIMSDLGWHRGPYHRGRRKAISWSSSFAPENVCASRSPTTPSCSLRPARTVSPKRCAQCSPR
ncbi:MAG: condensation domain-containing protein [Vulcanimicrobiaceae bacterium]